MSLLSVPADLAGPRASVRGCPSRALASGEKGAGTAVCQLRLTGMRPFVRERPCDRRHLGPVSAGHLRGYPRSTALPAGAPCKRARRWQRHFSHRVSPDRRGMASRDERCPERSGLGRSHGREQSRPRMSSIGFSTPDLEHLRRLPRSEGNFRPEHGSRPARGFRGPGCSSGPQSCSWRHPPAEIVRARAASPSTAKAVEKRSSRCLAQR